MKADVLVCQRAALLVELKAEKRDCNQAAELTVETMVVMSAYLQVAD